MSVQPLEAPAQAEVLPPLTHYYYLAGDGSTGICGTPLLGLDFPDDAEVECSVCLAIAEEEGGAE